MSHSAHDLWNALAARANLALCGAQHDAFSRYLDLLLEANATMNLTRISDRSAAESQHVGDALTLLPFLPPGEFALADVGSGGGAPGIVLAIARPEARVLLIESTKKKAAFLERAAAALQLTNVRVSADRAEDVGRSGRRATFDVVTSRAVATLDWLVEWCLPLLKTGGRMLAMKGPRAANELSTAAMAAQLLGGSAPISHPSDLPDAPSRVIIEIKKLRPTDAKYPRLATQAKGKPIIQHARSGPTTR